MKRQIWNSNIGFIPSSYTLASPFLLGQEHLGPSQTQPCAPWTSQMFSVLWKFMGGEFSALANLFCAKKLLSKDEAFVI